MDQRLHTPHGIGGMVGVPYDWSQGAVVHSRNVATSDGMRSKADDTTTVAHEAAPRLNPGNQIQHKASSPVRSGGLLHPV